MKKGTKNTIKLVVNSMFNTAIFLLIISACLFSLGFSVGIKLDPPFSWASFLQMGLLMLTSWAFNKELFYY